MKIKYACRAVATFTMSRNFASLDFKTRVEICSEAYWRVNSSVAMIEAGKSLSEIKLTKRDRNEDW